MSWDAHRVNHALKMRDAGFSASDIGHSLGVSKNAVIGKFYRLGLSKKDKDGHWSDERRAKFIALWTAKTPVRQIMLEMPMGRRAVYYRAAWIDLPKRGKVS